MSQPTDKIEIARILELERAREPKLDSGDPVWRSLDELAATARFRELLEKEYPGEAGRWTDPVSRRRFLHLLGASAALAGAVACTRQPEERIVPYVRAPENLIPGRSLQFATSVTLAGYGCGVLVESHEGRPTKIEGNPDHPASLGAAGVHAQASVLDLYDPDRLQSVSKGGRIRTWEVLVSELLAAVEPLRAGGGDGLHVLLPTLTSPSLAAQLAELQAELPQARLHSWEPAGLHNTRTGLQAAFGQQASVHYDLSQADVILALDSDFLTAGPGAVRYARDFAARRSPDDPERMTRLYVVESTPTPTGAAADHRLVRSPSDIGTLLWDVAAALGAVNGAAQPAPEAAAIAADLADRRGTGLIVVGETQPAEVHHLAHFLNQQLGNTGTTVHLTEPIEVGPVDHSASIAELTAAIDNETVEVLLILGGNPAFNAPANLDFAAKLAEVPLKIYLGLHGNETSALSDWVIPRSHELESWGDVRSFEGTATIVQPLIEPLYASRSALELVAALRGTGGRDYDLVRRYWRDRWGENGFEQRWRKALHDGLVEGSAAERLSLTTDAPPRAGTTTGGDLELLFRPDPSLFDGRYATNGWLQELPRPLTKLTWGNAVFVSPAQAAEWDLANGQVVEVAAGGSQVRGPAWILPGQEARTVTVHLGYGRREVGRVGQGSGFDAYPLRGDTDLWQRSGVTLRVTDEFEALACTQDHHVMEGRHLVRHADLDEFTHDPGFAAKEGHTFPDELDLYSDFPYTGYAWGLTVDLNKCTGCNACVVACQAENNIPVVGKEEVMMGREMQWIRIDRYFEGGVEEPEIFHQPVMCQHCEKAPCEVVCPVAATVHSDEGLNDMVYNRCVGTRYCSNNCPYKVRRFNLLLSTRTRRTESLRPPAAQSRTSRSARRGVMEKCTYCVQRINQAQHHRPSCEGREHRRRRGRDGLPGRPAPRRPSVFGRPRTTRAARPSRKTESQPAQLRALGPNSTRSHARTSYLTQDPCTRTRRSGGPLVSTDAGPRPSRYQPRPPVI